MKQNQKHEHQLGRILSQCAVLNCKRRVWQAANILPTALSSRGTVLLLGRKVTKRNTYKSQLSSDRLTISVMSCIHEVGVEGGYGGGGGSIAVREGLWW